MRNLGQEIIKNLNKVAVSYFDEGPEYAPSIIFIHGFPLDKSMWAHQLAALKENYRVIAYDVRGHGRSEAGIGEFTINQFTSDLINLMNALAIDKTILCGLSMGGYIALNAVEYFPNRFDALVLCDTTCIADSPESKDKRMKAIESIKENGLEQYAEESIKKLFSPGSLKAKEKEVAAIKEVIMNTEPESIYRTLRALAGRKETCSILPNIDKPVLIMVGEDDVLTPPAAAQQMHDNTKGSLMSIIPQAGHLSNLENPEVFNDQLINMLAAVTINVEKQRR